MPSIFTHPAAPLALSFFLPRAVAHRGLILAGVACAVIPDLDVIAFHFGIRGGAWGHRGFTHSIVFAVVLAAIVTFAFFRKRKGKHAAVFVFLFLATLSHPLLDMLTTGGYGVSLFFPFSYERVEFPWTPIEVSPIGFRFFSDRGLHVILSELTWVWLPAAVVALIAYTARRFGKGWTKGR